MNRNRSCLAVVYSGQDSLFGRRESEENNGNPTVGYPHLFAAVALLAILLSFLLVSLVVA